MEVEFLKYILIFWALKCWFLKLDLALNSDTVSMFVWPLKEDQVVIPLHHLGSLVLGSISLFIEPPKTIPKNFYWRNGGWFLFSTCVNCNISNVQI